MPDETGESKPVDHMIWQSPRWWRILVKELREILRDRRTIITLIAMPLLIYPLLGVTMQKLIVAQASSQNKVEYRIVLQTSQDLGSFWRYFRRGHALISQREGRVVNPAREAEGTLEDPFIEVITPGPKFGTADLDEVVAANDAEVGVLIGPQRDRAPVLIEIIFRPSSVTSCDARRFIEERFRAVNEEFAREMMSRMSPPVDAPLRIKAAPLTASGRGVGSSISLATLVPLILILMTVTGAVYPAIDLTAGERERGTLEALVASPVPRHELLFAKYLAVVSVAILTALANLSSMIVTAYSSGLESLLFGPAGLSMRLIGLTLGLLFVFAAFFSALILILTSFARSFKEAQAYLIPVMLVSLAPGVICLLPGIEFNAWLAVIPLANIVLLARDVFENRVVPLWALATLLSTVLYSAVALGAAARIFGTDAVLYGGDGGWSDLFRRPETARRQATLAQAMFGLAVLFPAFLILGGIATRMSETLSMNSRLALNALVTVGLFAGIPMVLTRFSAVNWLSGLSLRRAPALFFAAAVLLGLSLWPMAYELFLLQSPDRLDDLVKHLFETYKTQLDAVPLAWKLITLALVPAVCEELFFRGYLQTAFRAEMSGALAVGLSSMLFGLFHVVVRDALFFERFAPSCFLGLILGTLCLYSGSIWPGILLHSLHNGFLLTLSNYTEELKALGVGNYEAEHLPTTWLIVSACVATTAFGMVVFRGQSTLEDTGQTEKLDLS